MARLYGVSQPTVPRIAKHGDFGILPNICGLDFAAYELCGIQLSHTQTSPTAPLIAIRFRRRPELLQNRGE
jgi:hypothetical protein